MVCLIAGTWVVLSAKESYACECAAAQPTDALAEADSAFVGTLMERTKGGPSIPFYGDRVATFRFRVSDDLAGTLDDEIKVVSSPYGASCGLEVAEGARVGLFLTITNDGIWTSGRCSQVEPQVLLRAAAPLPEPDGVGPVWLFIGVAFLAAIAVACAHRSRAT